MLLAADHREDGSTSIFFIDAAGQFIMVTNSHTADEK